MMPGGVLPHELVVGKELDLALERAELTPDHNAQIPDGFAHYFFS